MTARKSDIPGGPEPQYDRVVSGYETFHRPEPFACEWGGVLPELTLAYETWGTPSPARDNAVFPYEYVARVNAKKLDQLEAEYVKESVPKKSASGV